MNRQCIRRRAARLAAAVFLFVAANAAFPENDGRARIHPAAAILLDESEFRIDGPVDARYLRHQRIRIDGPSGDPYAVVSLEGKTFIQNEGLEGGTQTIDGAWIRKIKGDMIRKEPYERGGILFEDGVTWQADLRLTTYPYIVDVRDEQKMKSLYFWPPWIPQCDVPVEKSTYAIRIPERIPFKTHAVGLDVQRDSSRDGSDIRYRWTIEGVPPSIDEDFMPPEARIQKILYLNPLTFELDGKTGSFESWAAFGDFFYGLNRGRDSISGEMVSEVKNLVRDAGSDIERVGLIYRYLQKNTRYVAIEKGIDGYRPRPAMYVCEKRYGDCKDLSCLMVGMLHAVGIPANPALVLTRDLGRIQAGFPNDQFNHVMVGVELPGKPLWLECTADWLHPGELPSDAEGASALLIRGDGQSFITETPRSGSENNVFYVETVGTISYAGIYQYETRVDIVGNSADKFRPSLIEGDARDRETAVSGMMGRYYPKNELTEYAFANLDTALDKPLTIRAKGSLHKLGTMNGKRIFINPNIVFRITPDDIPRETTRTFPVHHSFPFIDSLKVSITLPENLTVEAAPDTSLLRYPFGSYRSAYTLTGREFVYQKVYRIDQSDIQLDAYADYVNMLKTVARRESEQFVFRRP